MGIKRIFVNWLLKDASSAAGASNISEAQGTQPYHPAIPHELLIQRITSWVYAAINRNSSTASRVPLRLYARKPSGKQKARFPTRIVKGHELEYMRHKSSVAKMIANTEEVVEVLDHPLLTLLNNVNQFANAFDLLMHCFGSLDATGNGYWQKVRKGGLNTPPTEIWPRAPHQIKILPDPKKFIKGFEFGSGAQKIVVRPEDMVHFKYVSLKDNIAGVGPLEAAVTAADLSVAMNQYEVGMFKNGGVPDVVLSYKESVSPAEKKRVRVDYRRSFGMGRSGNLMIAEGGATIAPYSLSPKEMGFLQGRKWSREEILGIFGVPTAFVEVQNISRANAHEAKVIYAEQTIEPRLTLVEQKLNEQLVPDFDDNLFLSFDDPRPIDHEMRLKQIEIRLKNKMTTVNEERAIDGMEPVEWGEEPIITAPPAFGGSEPEESPEEEKRYRKQPILNRPAATFEPTWFIQKLEDYFLKVKLSILAKVLDEHFKQIKTKALADDLVAGWFDMEAMQTELRMVSMPFVRASMMIGGERALRKIVDIPFNPMHPGILGALEQRSGIIVNATHTTREAVRKAVAEGIAAGEGAVPIRKRISEVFDKASRYQAATIARTETIWAFNEGAVQGYIQSGIVSRKEWLTAADDRLCAWCAEMNGRTVEVTRAFIEKGEGLEVGGLRMETDYTDIGHPPLHSNCRCTIIPVLE